MRQTRGILAAAASVAVMAALIGGCAEKLVESQYTVGDRTGSWGQINQIVKRSDDWTQIVEAGTFQLGERNVKGQRELEDGTVTEYFEQGYGTYPSIDGSTVAVPMAVEFARQHLGLSDEDAAEFVQFSTTHNAYMNLISRFPGYRAMVLSQQAYLEAGKAVDLIIATEPSAAELAIAEAGGVELVLEPVCYDAFVFITHRDNPVESLTVEEIQQIYTGEITNWSQLGGADLPIQPFQREANSGSQTAMEQLVMKGKQMLSPQMASVVVGMGELIDTVAEYENDGASIGYTYLYYIDTLYRNEDVKVLAVEGIPPTVENLQSAKYPFTTNYYGVIRKGDEDQAGGRFLAWMLSEEGQRVIAQAGYVPLF